MKVVISSILILALAAIGYFFVSQNNNTSDQDDSTYDGSGSGDEVSASDSDADSDESDMDFEDGFPSPTLELEPIGEEGNQLKAFGRTKPYSTVRIYKDAECTISNGAGKADDKGNYGIIIALSVDTKWNFWVKATLGEEESDCLSEPVEYTKPE